MRGLARSLAPRVIRLLLRGRVSLPRRRRRCRGRPLLIGRSVGRCVLLSDGSVSKLAKSSFPSARSLNEKVSAITVVSAIHPSILPGRDGREASSTFSSCGIRLKLLYPPGRAGPESILGDSLEVLVRVLGRESSFVFPACFRSQKGQATEGSEVVRHDLVSAPPSAFLFPSISFRSREPHQAMLQVRASPPVDRS